MSADPKVRAAVRARNRVKQSRGMLAKTSHQFRRKYDKPLLELAKMMQADINAETEQ